MKARGAAVLGVGLVLGCGANDAGPVYAYLSLEGASAPPADVSLDPANIQMPEGVAVRITPVVMGTDGEPLRGEVSEFSLRSEGEDVFRVLPGPNEHDIVFVGAKRGTTRLIVTIQGVDVDAVPVRVLPQ